MAFKKDYDGIFFNLPAIQTEGDYTRFWDRGVAELKRIIIDSETKNSLKRSPRFDIYDVSFKSVQKSCIKGTLYIPKAANKPHPVIVLHDYNHPEPYKGFHLDDSIAYFFIQLRGHDTIKETESVKEVSSVKQPVKKTILESPGYIHNTILNLDSFYMRQICLDTLRAVDVLRLNRKLDCGSVGIIGKGVGALAALFAASRTNRVPAIVLDSPLFTWIQESQNHSESAAAAEINKFIRENGSKHSSVKRLLSYFDAIPLASEFSGHIMMSVGLKDKIAPPECSIALFNHFLCDKEMQVYPDDGNESGGEAQFKKASTWLKNHF